MANITSSYSASEDFFTYPIWDLPTADIGSSETPGSDNFSGRRIARAGKSSIDALLTTLALFQGYWERMYAWQSLTNDLVPWVVDRDGPSSRGAARFEKAVTCSIYQYPTTTAEGQSYPHRNVSTVRLVLAKHLYDLTKNLILRVNNMSYGMSLKFYPWVRRFGQNFKVWISCPTVFPSAAQPVFPENFDWDENPLVHQRQLLIYACWVMGNIANTAVIGGRGPASETMKTMFSEVHHYEPWVYPDYETFPWGTISQNLHELIGTLFAKSHLPRLSDDISRWRRLSSRGAAGVAQALAVLTRTYALTCARCPTVKVSAENYADAIGQFYVQNARIVYSSSGVTIEYDEVDGEDMIWSTTGGTLSVSREAGDSYDGIVGYLKTNHTNDSPVRWLEGGSDAVGAFVFTGESDVNSILQNSTPTGTAYVNYNFSLTVSVGETTIQSLPALYLHGTEPGGINISSYVGYNISLPHQCYVRARSTRVYSYEFTRQDAGYPQFYEYPPTELSHRCPADNCLDLAGDVHLGCMFGGSAKWDGNEVTDVIYDQSKYEAEEQRCEFKFASYEAKGIQQIAAARKAIGEDALAWLAARYKDSTGEDEIEYNDHETHTEIDSGIFINACKPVKSSKANLAHTYASSFVITGIANGAPGAMSYTNLKIKNAESGEEMSYPITLGSLHAIPVATSSSETKPVYTQFDWFLGEVNSSTMFGIDWSHHALHLDLTS